MVLPFLEACVSAQRDDRLSGALLCSGDCLMATLAGGLRDRMIFDSVMNGIVADLTTIGWFDATVSDTPPGTRQHLSITAIDEFPDPDTTTEIALNTLAFSFADATGTDMEMGSNQEEHATTLFVDFFAENDAVGRELQGDIYAYLKKNRAIPVFDYRQATPPIEFRVEVEDGVDKRKPTRATNPWQKHWYVVAFVVTDERSNA